MVLPGAIMEHGVEDSDEEGVSLARWPRCRHCTQLSPGIILMSGGVHDGGILQSSLFTSRSQNKVLGKLRKSGFWS